MVRTDTISSCPACLVGKRGRIIQDTDAYEIVTVKFEEASSYCGVEKNTLALVDIAENNNGEAK